MQGEIETLALDSQNCLSTVALKNLPNLAFLKHKMIWKSCHEENHIDPGDYLTISLEYFTQAMSVSDLKCVLNSK